MDSGESANLNTLSTEDYLRQFGIDQSAILDVSDQGISDIVPIEADTDKFLEEFARRHSPGLSKAEIQGQTKIFDLTKEEERRAADMTQRLWFRRTVLFTQLVPMCLIPLWLVVILSLPVFGVKQYSEDMQKGFLGALATNAFGICLIIARDIFPLGKEEGKSKKNDWTDITLRNDN
jgi:hypothetical protein